MKQIVGRYLVFAGILLIPGSTVWALYRSGSTVPPAPIIKTQEEVMGIFTTPSPTPTPTPTPTPKPTPTPTNTPTPKPTPYPVTGSQLDNWFTHYANFYSIDRQKLWSVAVCESGLRVSAVNGDYAGLFQFSPSTWIAVRLRMNMPHDPALRFNPEESIRTAAFKMSQNGYGAWPNCGN